MKLRYPVALLSVLAFSAPSFPGVFNSSVAPYVSDNLQSSNQTSQQWQVNGTVTQNSAGATVTSTSGAALISKVAVPDSTTQYQVSFSTNAPNDSHADGWYILYLQATQNAKLNPNGASTGSFYAFAVRAYAMPNGDCSSQVTLYKTVNGSVAQISTRTLACQLQYIAIASPDGSVRLAVPNTDAAPGTPPYTVPVVWYDNGTPLYGSGGVGLVGPTDGSGAHASKAELFAVDRTAPSTIASGDVKSYLMPTQVDLQSAGSADDTQGVGVYQYNWYRDGQCIASSFTPEYSDLTVTAGSSHTYGLSATDYDGNTSATTTVSITTPTSNSVSPRQIGVRGNGSYWGGQGEQIDMRSGNLNFYYPLLTIVNRTLSLPLGLSYNSQNWRKDSNNTNWNLGFDIGTGYGWQLQFGSITPYSDANWNTVFYIFRDATGATYKLDQSSNGLWTSKDSTYVTYNEYSNDLLFDDGSLWAFHVTSGGLEPDAGTLYPTFLRDSHGNYVYVEYQPAKGDPSQGSSRIATIWDVRSYDGSTPPYVFQYDASGYLTSISNNIADGNSFSFAYTSVTLASPFSSTSFGAVKLLSSITNTNTGLATSFNYDSSNSGELTKVSFPYGGYLRWQYGAIDYAQASLRSVQNRYLLWDSYIGERSFTMAQTLSGDSSVTAQSVLTDALVNAGKKWTFNTAQSIVQGLVATYQESNTSTGKILRQFNYTWTQDPAGRSYISRTQDILDPGQSYAATRQSDQTLDRYGNLTQTKLYSFSDLSAPAKTYNYTYLAGGNYASQNIFDRLQSSTVTDANGTITLATHSYDQAPISDAPGALWLDASYADPNFMYRGTPTSSLSFQHTSNRRFDITGATVYTDDGNVNHSLTMTNASSTGYSRPSAITTANSLSTGFTWNTALAPLSRTGWNSDVDSVTYDVSTARPATKVSPYGAVTNFSYSNSAPQIVATTNNRWEKTSLDGLGRVAKVERGDNGTTRSVTDIVYDTCGCTPTGKMYLTSMPYVPGATRVWTSYSYDALGRTILATKPDRYSTTSYSYAGATVTITNPSGQWKKLTRDAFGQLVKVEEPSPNSASEPNHVTLYTYDVLGHLTQVKMDRTIGGTVRTQYRTWVYDLNTQLLTSKTTPEAGTVTYTYNADRTLATKTDAKNQRAVYTYDNFGRIVQIVRGTVSGGVFTEDLHQRTTFAYEGINGGYSSATKGRISQVAYNAPHGLSMVEMYSYHNGGRVTKKRVQIAGTPLGASTVTLDAGYTYDNEGRTTSIQYPSSQIDSSGTATAAGPLYTYGYDAMGRLNQMTDAGTSWVSGVTYGAADELLAMTANGFSETRTYNANLQLTELISGSGVHRQYNYSASQNNGQITSQQDLVSGETISYQYDSLKRLIQASATGDPSGAWSQNFTYDGFGNLTAKTSTNAPQLSVAVDWATNRIQSFSTYDANGNMTGYAGDGYAYDIENRMTIATVSGMGTTLYGYDTTNHRVYKSAYNISAGTYSAEEFYFYGAEGHKYGTWKINPSSGVLLQATVTKQWFGGRLVSPEDRMGSKGRYFAYGEDRLNVSPANPSNDQEKFATFTRDSGTALDYADQRFYSSITGRFMRPDPLEGSANVALPQTWNRYAYVSDDPSNSNDPNGLCSVVLGGINQSPYTDPTSVQQEFANEIGAISAFPFAGTGTVNGFSDIVVQDLGFPTGATANALNAIALAAQNPGPINIYAYSGGAATLALAWNYLTDDVKNRIQSITYIDPAEFNSLPVGVPGTSLQVFSDSTKAVNIALSLTAGGLPVFATYYSTGTCGHNANCVFGNYAATLAQFSSDCSIGVGGVFGYDRPTTPYLYNFADLDFNTLATFTPIVTGEPQPRVTSTWTPL